MQEQPQYEDQKVREYLLPKRVVQQKGAVENAGLLTSTAAKQIGLNEQKYVHIVGKSRIVLDFGRELRGGLRIVTGIGSDAVKVRLRLGESVGECLAEIGQKGCTNNHALRDMTVLLPMLSDQEFFDSGFRFACIDFLEDRTDLRLKAINAVFLHDRREQVGFFHCSDALIDRIYDTAAYTVRLCAQEYVWDGIKRDRLVWVGDLYPEICSLLSVCADDGCVTNSLDYVQAETPLPRWMNDYPMYSMWWIIILEEYYRLSGNEGYVRSKQAYYEGLICQIDRCIAEDGSFDFGMNFVDWPTHGHPDEEEGVRCLCKLCAQSGARLEEMFAIRTGAAESIQRKISRRGAEVTEKKQIVALKYLCGTPLSEREKALFGRGGARGFSTFMSYFLLTALSETHGEEQALAALKEYYGGMLRMGATTFWEDFDVDWMQEPVCPIDRLRRSNEKDIHGDFGRFCYTGYRHSLCHGWSAGVVPFLFRRILGIRTDAAENTVHIAPRLGGLAEAEGEFPLPQGVLRMRCRQQGDALSVEYDAPAGVAVHLEK